VSGRHGRKGSSTLAIVAAATAALLLLAGGVALAVRAARASKPPAPALAAAAPGARTAAVVSTASAAATPSAGAEATTTSSSAVTSTEATAEASAQSVPVLMYHHVMPDPSNFIAISPATFEKQMAYLAEGGFHPVTMAQFADYMTKGAPLPAKAVLITFDDGRRNQLDYAVPVLKRHGFPATFFVTRKWVVGSSKSFMHEADLSRLAAEGFDIESHTTEHTILVRSRSEDRTLMFRRLDPQVERSWVERISGKPVIGLAYPGGGHDAMTPDLAKAAGYAVAFTTDGGPNRYRSQSPFLVRRDDAGARGISMPSFIAMVTRKPKE
jgi:peptidoglycan/xylan/chitin deacetylase (PgdA/CDA1 family)